MAGPTDAQKKTLHDFMARQRYAVISTVSEGQKPEAALVGVAVTPDLELIFETTDATRKFANLKRNPHLAAVLGEDQQTLQYEGVVDEPIGSERDTLLKIFFEAWPDLRAHQDWPGLTYFRVRPTWIRFSSYYRPRHVDEIVFEIEDAPKQPTGLLAKMRSLFNPG
ncbi:MAG TPA: pyridoxamine 5'-phosphate oxidase family protein [Rhizomicrobium sp.]|nr:pyridoxamine 5'-phosphate oxidase family protein [Rhizomicrobium sp.]